MTTSDTDGNLAQNTVISKAWCPFRIQAEHEALQGKLEAAQMEQKRRDLVLDPRNPKDFERPLKEQPRSHEQVERSYNETGDSMPPKSSHAPISLESKSHPPRNQSNNI